MKAFSQSITPSKQLFQVGMEGTILIGFIYLDGHPVVTLESLKTEILHVKVDYLVKSYGYDIIKNNVPCCQINGI